MPRWCCAAAKPPPTSSPLAHLRGGRDALFTSATSLLCFPECLRRTARVGNVSPTCQRCHKHKQRSQTVAFVDFLMGASGTKSLFFLGQRSQSGIVVRPQRVSGDNPVFVDPLTRRHLVVLARSWSCQRGIYGRSVFNLQKWTLPESRGGTKRRVSGGNQARTFCLDAERISQFAGHR